MALLSMPETKMSDAQLEKLTEQVRRAEEEGR